jgi:hypothetical protein
MTREGGVRGINRQTLYSSTFPPFFHKKNFILHVGSKTILIFNTNKQYCIKVCRVIYLKGYCHEMDIFFENLNILVKYFLCMHCWFPMPLETFSLPLQI